MPVEVVVVLVGQGVLPLLVLSVTVKAGKGDALLLPCLVLPCTVDLAVKAEGAVEVVEAAVAMVSVPPVKARRRMAVITCSAPAAE